MEEPVYPILFHFGHLNLPTFGVLAALGLMLALLLSERTAVLAGVDADKLWDAGIFAAIAAFVLSRLLLAATYWKSFQAFPLLLLMSPSLTPIGLALTAIATAVWLWFRRVPLLRALDAWAPCGMLVWACLALGHFAEGSDPGLTTTLPWGLPPMRGEVVRLHPVALYVAFLALLLASLSYWLLRRGLRAGAVAGWTLAAAGFTQFLASFLRQPGAAELFGLDLLQCVAVGMIVLGFGLVSGTLLPIERQ
jgi:phosphatidylglycerol:prolipoprotein diacylglycerol transferase